MNTIEKLRKLRSEVCQDMAISFQSASWYSQFEQIIKEVTALRGVYDDAMMVAEVQRSSPSEKAEDTAVEERLTELEKYVIDLSEKIKKQARKKGTRIYGGEL